ATPRLFLPQNTQLLPDALEGAKDLVKVLVGVGGHVRRAQEALALGDRGGDHRVYEDALDGQAAVELERRLVRPDDDGQDGRAVIDHLEAEVLEPLPHALDVPPEAGAALGLALDDVEA